MSAPPSPVPFENFVAAIDAGDDEAAEALVCALGTRDESALRALADSPDPDRRWWAVRALADCGGGDSVATLMDALTEPDASLRAAAALGLGHLGQRLPQAVEPALPTLARLLEDDDGFVRQAAVDGFSLCGEGALPVLTGVLYQSTHEGARTRATCAVRNVRSLQAAPVLFHCLNDPNHLVRAYAYEALDELGLLETMLLMP